MEYQNTMNDEQALFTHLRVNRAKASRKDFALAVGTTESTLSRVESGLRKASFDLVIKLRHAMLKLVDDFSDAEMFDFDRAREALAEPTSVAP